MKDDSIDGIYDTLKQCALVSKSAGGIGLAVSCIRATGSYIAGVTKMLFVSLKTKLFFFLATIADGGFCFSDKWEVQWARSYASSLQQHSTLC